MKVLFLLFVFALVVFPSAQWTATCPSDCKRAVRGACECPPSDGKCASDYILIPDIKICVGPVYSPTPDNTDDK